VLPFTAKQFFALFAEYNEEIWPAQVVAYLLGGVAVIASLGREERSDRIAAAVLAIMWAWTGLAYHLAFFATINKAAYAFCALFVIQAAAFAYAGVLHHHIAFGFRSDATGWVGVIFLVYAAAAYPFIGMVTGHSYPALPTFGVTPCPVTIFTFGMLLLTRRPIPILLLAIPVLWSLVGGSAAILLHVPQDWLLLASGIIALPLVVTRDRKRVLT
jgi:uncharacterized protein DUF6064